MKSTKNTPSASSAPQKPQEPQNLQKPQKLQQAQKPQQSPKSPTSAEVLALIESLRGNAAKYGHDDRWIAHTICVGDCAGKLAAATKTLDPDRAKALGYLHDIGKGIGPLLDHVENGYRYLKDLGYADEYCSVCLTHSFTAGECEMISGYRPASPFLRDYIASHQNTPYEDLVALCDLYCKDELLPLEIRLVDVIIRYGSSERTQHRLEEIYRLKSKIEQQINQTVEAVLDLPPVIGL